MSQISLKLDNQLCLLLSFDFLSAISYVQKLPYLNDQYVLIEQLSDFLMGAILMQNHISIERSREVCKVLFKNLREQVQQKIADIPEI